MREWGECAWTARDLTPYVECFEALPPPRRVVSYSKPRRIRWRDHLRGALIALPLAAALAVELHLATTF